MGPNGQQQAVIVPVGQQGYNMASAAPYGAPAPLPYRGPEPLPYPDAPKQASQGKDYNYVIMSSNYPF